MIAIHTYSILMTASEQTQFNRNARSVLILCGFAALILIIVGAKLLFDHVIGPKLDELESRDSDNRKTRKKSKNNKNAKNSNNNNGKNNNGNNKNNQNDKNNKSNRSNSNYEENGGVDQNTGSLHFASLDDTEDADYGEDD